MAEYIWKDFTKNDLKAWILANTSISSWDNCHDITLNNEQIASLEKELGCTITSTGGAAIKILFYPNQNSSPQYWCIGTADNTNISLSFNTLYKKVKITYYTDGEQTSIYDNNGNAIEVSNIQAIDQAMDAAESFLWGGKFLDYVELTDTFLDKNTKTSGQLLYDKAYLTALGNYSIAGKQFNTITNPEEGIEITNEGFIFDDISFPNKQNYGDVNHKSNRYQYWATDSRDIVIVKKFEYGWNPDITEITDTSFKINGVLFKKRPSQDVYILQRKAREASLSSVVWDTNKPYTATYAEDMDIADRTSENFVGVYNTTQGPQRLYGSLVHFSPARCSSNTRFVVWLQTPSLKWKKVDANDFIDIPPAIAERFIINKSQTIQCYTTESLNIYAFTTSGRGSWYDFINRRTSTASFQLFYYPAWSDGYSVGEIHIENTPGQQWQVDFSVTFPTFKDYIEDIVCSSFRPFGSFDMYLTINNMWAYCTVGGHIQMNGYGIFPSYIDLYNWDCEDVIDDYYYSRYAYNAGSQWYNWGRIGTSANPFYCQAGLNICTRMESSSTGYAVILVNKDLTN